MQFLCVSAILAGIETVNYESVLSLMLCYDIYIELDHFCHFVAKFLADLVINKLIVCLIISSKINNTLA